MSEIPLRERYGVRVMDKDRVRGTVTKYDEPVTYDYERELVFVRLDRDSAGQDLYWYDEAQLRVVPGKRHHDE